MSQETFNNIFANFTRAIEDEIHRLEMFEAQGDKAQAQKSFEAALRWSVKRDEFIAANRDAYDAARFF